MGSPLDLYLNLIKDCLVDNIYPHEKDKKHTAYDKYYGRYWPAQAHTMAGVPRLENVEFCVKSVIEDDIPGDLIECGVWRGGIAILMQAILKAYGQTNRRVFVADSFEGLPEADLENWPKDKSNIDFSKIPELAISLTEVKNNFKKYRLLDDNVIFHKGFFEDTIADIAAEQLAVLRLDGDMYSSTYVCLEHLYPKLARGGYCIIDDYGALRQATDATNDYKLKYGIDEQIIKIEVKANDSQQWGVFWRKS